MSPVELIGLARTAEITDTTGILFWEWARIILATTEARPALEPSQKHQRHLSPSVK
jgi:hypothetical protein